MQVSFILKFSYQKIMKTIQLQSKLLWYHDFYENESWNIFQTGYTYIVYVESSIFNQYSTDCRTNIIDFNVYNVKNICIACTLYMYVKCLVSIQQDPPPLGILLWCNFLSLASKEVEIVIVIQAKYTHIIGA